MIVPYAVLLVIALVVARNRAVTWQKLLVIVSAFVMLLGWFYVMRYDVHAVSTDRFTFAWVLDRLTGTVSRVPHE